MSSLRTLGPDQILSIDDLRLAGERLFGRWGWQTRLSEALEVDGSTVRRWVSGAVAVPNPAKVAIRLMLGRGGERSPMRSPGPRSGRPRSTTLARERTGPTPRPALFLDRDGVLNVDAGYVIDREQFVWIDGAREAVRLANDLGYLTVVATNQSGVARGYFTEADVEALHGWMRDQLAEIGARIDAFYVAPHHPDAVVERYRHPDHPDRKPNPGMLLRAIADLNIDPARSVLIGDQPRDIEAARRAGVRGVLFEGGDLRETVRTALDAIDEGLDHPI